MPVVRLADWRLSGSGAWRAAMFLSIALSIVFTASVLYLGAKGHGSEAAGAVERSAILIAWVAGGVLSWWSATDRAGADRADGVPVLARLHGLRTDWLPAARCIVATVRLSVLVALSILPVAIASMATAPSVHLALWRLAALAPIGLYATAVGLVGGALACACGAASPRHGRSLFAALVLGPWALEGLLVASSSKLSSLPALLGFLAHVAARTGAGT